MTKKIKKNPFKFLTAAFFLIAAAGACGVRKQDGDAAGSGPATLTIWQTYNNEEHEVFLEIVRDYLKNRPGLDIKVQRIPWDQHITKLKVAMITRTVPDIARVDLAFMPRLVKSRSVADLTDYGADGIIPRLVPAAAQSNVFPESFYIKGSTSTRKRVFGLPDQTTGVALFYNKKMFAAAGLSRAPSDWDEFARYAKILTRDTVGDGRTDQFGFAADLSLWFTFPFFNTYGVRFISDDGRKCLLDSREARDALQLKVDLYHKHKAEAGAWQAGAISPDTGFLNRKYAMIFTGPWNLKRFKDAGLPFGVSLIPRGPAGTSTNVGGSSMVVFRTSRRPDEAYKFLEYLVSVPVQKKWAQKLSQIPVNLGAYPLVDVSELPELKVFMEQMKTAVARPKVMDYDELESIMNAEMYTALYGQKTVERALADAVREIDRRVLNIE